LQLRWWLSGGWWSFVVVVICSGKQVVVAVAVAVGYLSVVVVARVVEGRWIGGGLVVARSRVLAVEC
jgi:hypothetical protein